MFDTSAFSETVGNTLQPESNEGVRRWLTEVNLSNTGLASLPTAVTDYSICTYLNLSGNRLVGSFDWVICLRRLRHLDLSNNCLSELGEVCLSVSTLEELDLSHNLFNALPEWILSLEKIKHLNLSCNPLQETFHSSLKMAKWERMVTCHLRNVNLTAVPGCLLGAKHLKELYVGNDPHFLYKGKNSLWGFSTMLPSSMQVLNLNFLNLSSMKLEGEGIGCLKTLSAKGNDLLWPPEAFTSLKLLESCDMSSCRLLVLPPNFGCLHHLHSVHLANNKLASIPISMELLSNLVVLDLYNNQIESIDCNLTKLKGLLKCDLWMNLMEPSQVLFNHNVLCQKLREDLDVEEKKMRRTEVANNVRGEELESDDVGYWHDDPRDASSAGDTAEFEKSSDSSSPTFVHSNDIGIEKAPEAEFSYPDVGLESWDDDDVYWDQDQDAPCHASSPECSYPSEHYHTPSDLHTTKICTNVIKFAKSVPGQYDDME